MLHKEISKASNSAHQQYPTIDEQTQIDNLALEILKDALIKKTKINTALLTLQRGCSNSYA